MPEYIAIGDIHGMSSMLDELLLQLPKEGTVVFLGDYIDRGPDSYGVIKRLIALQQEREVVFLRGNHEELCLDSLSGNSEAVHSWLANGGLATIESYQEHSFDEHLDFLNSTRLVFETEDYIFVHAGISPMKPVNENGAEEFLWIRYEFLMSDYDWGKMVIHGHTPTIDFFPEDKPNRINIDTGAFFKGRLTALILPEVEVISVEHPDSWALKRDDFFLM